MSHFFVLKEITLSTSLEELLHQFVQDKNDANSVKAEGMDSSQN